MPSPQYPVTSQPRVIFQSGQRQPADTVFNAGSTPVYVDSVPQSSTNQGTLLNAGAILPWPAGTYLSVVAATPGTVQLLGSDALNYWDPVSLANAIVTVQPGGQTLAQQIATAELTVVDGSGFTLAMQTAQAILTQTSGGNTLATATGGSTQTLLTAAGVPPIDAPVTLLNVTPSVASGATYDATVLDMRRYQGYSFVYTETSTYTGISTRLVTVKWFADAGATQFITEDYYSVMAYNGVIEVQGVTKGPFCWVQMGAFTTGSAATVLISVTGYYRQLPVRELLSSANPNRSGLLVQQGWNGSAIMTWSGRTMSAVQDNPVMYSGPAVALFTNLNATSAAAEFSILDAFTLSRIQSLFLPAGAANSASAQVILPSAAITMYVSSGSTAWAGTASITMQRNL